MIGFVLAAGFGTRMKPLTERLPKALVPVAGQPLLAHALARLATARPARLLANTHYLPEQMTAALPHLPHPCELVHEAEIRGTGGALLHALPHFGDDDLVCLLNVDILLDVDLPALTAAFLASGAAVGLAAVPVTGRGTLRYDPASGAYRGVPAEGPAAPGDADADYLGLAWYRRDFLRLLRPDDFSVVPVWGRAAAAGCPVRVMLVPPGTWWRDIGTPQALADVHLELAAGRAPLALPPGLHRDVPSATVWPAELPADRRGDLGPRAWLETPLPPGTTLRHVVALAGAALPARTACTDCLYTPWGDVPLAP
jgi:MurNAc alpha-1-phosphate uridylyltransferase